MTDSIMLNEGERAERLRRRKFWDAIGATAIFGLPIGFFLGRSAGRNGGSISEAFVGLSPGLTIGLLTTAVLGFMWGCWIFYKNIDEVEIVDNLWGSTAGFYFYMIAFPVWWVLWIAELAIQPNQWIIFTGALTFGTIIYLYRKWRAR